MKNPANIKSVLLSECQPAKLQRKIDGSHVDALVEAHKKHVIDLKSTVIAVMHDPDNTCKYAIIDGQHRWSAFKKWIQQNQNVNIGQLTRDEFGGIRIKAVVFARNLSLEHQRIVANIGDEVIKTILPFSNSDLVSFKTTAANYLPFRSKKFQI
jgi:hypothetical protein